MPSDNTENQDILNTIAGTSGRADERTSGRAALGLAQPLTWQKASASNTGGNCVELTKLPNGVIAIRDSKDPTGPYLSFTPAEFAAFLDGAVQGEFDRLLQR